MSRHGPRWITGLLLAAALAACAPEEPPVVAAPPAATPEPVSLTTKAEPTRAAPNAAARHVGPRRMVATAHPLATEAGLGMLRRGGSAVDAAIAAQLVLNLVEPQSSGIGGGGFLLHYAAGSGAIDSYDGRETAPASARPDMFLTADGHRRPFRDVALGGLPVGVPGLLRMLEMAHGEHGRLPWRDLFAPAIAVAESGFAVSPRLARAIAATPDMRRDGAAADAFLDADGQPPAAGRLMTNPTMAATLRAIAAGGADAFYDGPIADAIVAAVAGAPHNPTTMTRDDLSRYRAVKRPALCRLYRVWLVCGMGPPSSGGITTLQTLGILQAFDLGAMAPLSAEAVHLIAEAGRLAFADRNVYIADPDVIPVPIAGLIDPAYLGRRG